MTDPEDELTDRYGELPEAVTKMRARLEAEILAREAVFKARAERRNRFGLWMLVPYLACVMLGISMLFFLSYSCSLPLVVWMTVAFLGIIFLQGTQVYISCRIFDPRESMDKPAKHSADS